MFLQARGVSIYCVPSSYLRLSWKSQVRPSLTYSNRNVHTEPLCPPSFETLVVGIQYLVDALADHPDLMMKVLSFLPRECTFRLSSDFDKTRTVYITTPMGTVPRAAFGMIHKDGIHPEPPIVDQLITRLISSALFTVETKVSQETLVSLKGGDATRALQIMNEVRPSY